MLPKSAVGMSSSEIADFFGFSATLLFISSGELGMMPFSNIPRDSIA
jgi:hypothetical protein